MTEPAKERRAERVYSGMAPPFYDRVSIAYPSSTTEEYTYSAVNPATGVNQVMGIVEVVYVDSSKALISSVSRLL